MWKRSSRCTRRQASIRSLNSRRSPSSTTTTRCTRPRTQAKVLRTLLARVRRPRTIRCTNSSNSNSRPTNSRLRSFRSNWRGQKIKQGRERGRWLSWRRRIWNWDHWLTICYRQSFSDHWKHMTHFKNLVNKYAEEYKLIVWDLRYYY